MGAHAWHPFPAKFPPQLPAFLIDRLSDRGDVVLDPMAGSGTTLLEAVRLGRRAIGCDIDPLARMIAAAKLDARRPLGRAEGGPGCPERRRERLPRERRGSCGRDLDLRFDARTREFVDYWFLSRHQLELLALLQRIEALPQGGTRAFLEVMFSSTIIAKSGGVSLARDLAHTRPHRDLDKNPGSTFAEFAKRLKRNAASLEASGANDAGEAEVLEALADDTGLPAASVDLIVTSPPYANNAIDYMRAHKFSLVVVRSGRSPTSQTSGRGTSDTMRHPAPGTTTCPTSANARSNDWPSAMPGKRRTPPAILRRDGRRDRPRCGRVLKPNGAAVVVVGTSNLRGIDVGDAQGARRHRARAPDSSSRVSGSGALDRDRRMMPARWGARRESQIEERMHGEYVIGRG